MKKILIKISWVLSICIALILSACKDESSSSGVILSAYGPLPVIRGESIQFVGENLDKIQEVVLPEDVVISELIDQNANGFSIVVPQDAVAGEVILNYAGGTITAKVPISFEEPILMEGIVLPSEQIRAGQEITLQGDYLYNITAVVFSGGATVEAESFIAQSREEITLVVPKEAISGLIYLIDAEDNQYYAETPLDIMQPVIKNMSPLMIKAGEALTLNGTDLDLVAQVIFPGDITVEQEDFTSASKEQIVVTTPMNMLDGAITLVSFGKQNITSSETLETILPTDIVLSTQTRYKAGETLEIKGTNLDLVNKINFTANEEKDYILGEDFAIADGTISILIPSVAQNGVLQLHTQSAKYVETGALTLVEPSDLATDKPEYITEDQIIISGKDLDLVTEVKLNGNNEVFTLEGDQIIISTTKSSTSGSLVLVLANGKEVVVNNQLTVTPNSEVVISNLNPTQAQVGAEVMIEGSGFNKIESIQIADIKVIEYLDRTSSSIRFLVPEGIAPGSYPLVFNLTSGVSETSITLLEIVGANEIIPIWEGSFDFGGWSNMEDFSWNKTSASTKLMAEIKYGATLILKGSVSAGGQIKIMNPNGWTPIPESALFDSYVAQYGVIELAEGEMNMEIKLSDSTVDAIKAAGIVFGGKLFVLESLSLSYPIE